MEKNENEWKMGVTFEACSVQWLKLMNWNKVYM